MQKVILAACMSVVAGLTTANGTGDVSQQISPCPMTIAVDSAMFRNDVTRVYCRVIGHPHTSQRIDAASLVVNDSELQSMDIDGVDFKRYFQWEDNGCIALELDFAPTQKSNQVQIKLLTCKGVVSSPTVILRDGKAIR